MESWPFFTFSDAPPPAGVMVSVPLTPDLHVFNSSASSDISRSWSTSEAISLTETASGYTVSVSVYNFGLSRGFIFVELVLWYLKDDGSRTSISVPHASGLLISGAKGNGTPGLLKTAPQDIPNEPQKKLTHVYAVAHDPIMDPHDQWSSSLIQSATPDFTVNAARQSRHVACLNVAYAKSRHAFTLKWIFAGAVGHVSPMIENSSNAPLDVCVVSTSGVIDRVSLVTPHRIELTRDIRSAVGQVLSEKEASVISHTHMPILQSQNPRCDPTCSHDRDDYDEHWFAFIKDVGVEIDGKHSGPGMVVDVPNFTFSNPWTSHINQAVALRFLLR